MVPLLEGRARQRVFPLSLTPFGLLAAVAWRQTTERLKVSNLVESFAIMVGTVGFLVTHADRAMMTEAEQVRPGLRAVDSRSRLTPRAALRGR
jgi:hypothetical protein